MNLLFSTLQILGWVGVGYNINSGNSWAIFACLLFSLFVGLANAMNEVGKVMINGNSSTSK